MVQPSTSPPKPIKTASSATSISSQAASTHLRSSTTTSSPTASQRTSVVGDMRGIPQSPSQRAVSQQQAIQDLINNPPVGLHRPEDAKFAGRDWRTIKIGEIIDPQETRFVQADTSVEEATKILTTSGAPNVVLIRADTSTRAAIGAFDYDDLIAYLLLVTELAIPTNADEKDIVDVLRRARAHESVPLTDIKYLLGRKEPPAFMEDTDDLTKAVEIFGSGIHRIIVRKQGTAEVAGICSQLRLVRFFWENVKSFGVVDALHMRTLKDLSIHSHQVVSIKGDQPLKDALLSMHTQGITSLPVLDSHKNVVGNISHVDSKLLTTTAAVPLLDQSCAHFITVILSERGLTEGQDSYPVFHVTQYSTLAHTVAKLVATRSHRMWVVEAPSPRSSIPPSPSIKPISAPGLPPAATPPYTPTTPALANPGALLSGHLSGVISLTDVLNLYARASGLSPSDPEETRQRRRTSSSSSVRSNSVRASIEGTPRGSVDIGRQRK